MVLPRSAVNQVCSGRLPDVAALLVVTVVEVGIVVVVVMAILAVLGYLVRRDLRTRRADADSSRAIHQALEPRVAGRAAELNQAGKRESVEQPRPRTPAPSSTASAASSPTEVAARQPVVADAEPERVRVLLADDHAVVRKGLADVIRDERKIELVGEACDGWEAVEMAGRLRPDVIVMDVSMPRLDGVEAIRRIRADLPGCRVIGLSMHESDDIAQTMREAGAVAYFNKSQAADILIDSILAQVTPTKQQP